MVTAAEVLRPFEILERDELDDARVLILVVERRSARHCSRDIGDRSASEGDSETNLKVVWWPMKRVKSSNQEFAIAGRLVTIRTFRTSSVPHQVVRRQRLAEPRLRVPENLGLPGLEGREACSTAACCSGRRT